MFEVSVGSLVEKNDSRRGMSCVTSITVSDLGFTEISTQDCWFYEGRLCYDYECYGEYSVEDFYEYYELVGEDYKLFNKGI